MKVLLDTHALVWALSEPERLSVSARRAVEQSEVVVSIASLWEMILKKSKKDGLLKDPFDRILLAQALYEKAKLVSRDRALADYGGRIIW